MQTLGTLIEEMGMYNRNGIKIILQIKFKPNNTKSCSNCCFISILHYCLCYL